jgi:hypothetical protein
MNSQEGRIHICVRPAHCPTCKRDFKKDKSSPSGYICKVSSAAAASFDYAATQWMNKEARALNAVIKNGVKVAKAGDANLQSALRESVDLQRSWTLRQLQALDQQVPS